LQQSINFGTELYRNIQELAQFSIAATLQYYCNNIVC